MMTKQQSKQVFLIGGPNGAGKTTSAFHIMPELINCYEYVNADSIAASLSPFNPQALAMKSGRIMLSRIKELAALEVTFAFETTSASRSFAPFLKQCQAAGYEVNLMYVWVMSPLLAVERVQQRVLNGGHDIPPAVIERRYHRSMQNFIKMYAPIADRWVLCDNSSAQTAVLAVKQTDTQQPIIFDEELWAQFLGDANE